MWSAAMLCTLGVTKPVWGCTCLNFRQGLAAVWCACFLLSSKMFHWTTTTTIATATTIKQHAICCKQNNLNRKWDYPIIFRRIYMYTIRAQQIISLFRTTKKSFDFSILFFIRSIRYIIRFNNRLNNQLALSHISHSLLFSVFPFWYFYCRSLVARDP